MSTQTESATDVASEETNALDWLALALVVVGALNWGLVGIGTLFGAELNLVALLFGAVPALEAVVYLVVGIAGVYVVYFATQLR